MSLIKKENESEVVVADISTDAPAEEVWDEEHVEESIRSLNEMYRQVSHLCEPKRVQTDIGSSYGSSDLRSHVSWPLLLSSIHHVSSHHIT
jgi:hypothetical protein